MATIAILLATYNGEKFLQAQLQSIIDQTYSNWKLYIRDDCSTDATISMITDFEKKYPEKVKVLSNLQKNLGAKMSFGELLKEADEPYYMFCDQDDVWLPTKIERSFSEMKKAEEAHPGSPVLCFCDATVTDEKLQVISPSFWKSTRVNPFSVKKGKMFEIFNCAPGCTMILNRSLKNHLFPFPKKAPMHDWWISIMAQRKGIVNPIDERLIFYRQHSSNTIGAEDVARKYFFKKLGSLPILIETQRNHLAFLNEIGGMRPLEFYWTKLRYTFKRFIGGQ